MNRKQRITHFYTWILLAVLLPLLMLIARLATPLQPTQILFQPSDSSDLKLLPVVAGHRKAAGYDVYLRCSQDSVKWQLEWINKQELKFPTAAVYKVPRGEINVSNSELIGRIEARGLYHFPLRRDSTNQYHFMLYDFIHNKVIDTLNF